MSAPDPYVRPGRDAHGGAATPAPGWRAGVAVVDITPHVEIWMGGYAARTQPSQGVALPLRAKALALEDEEGEPAVLVSADLLGLTERMTARIAATIQRRHGLPRARLLLNATHTHCGPVTDDLLAVAYDLTPEQRDVIHAYTEQVEARLIAAIGDALSRLQPARLTFGEGEADFAANRRVQFSPEGPVDRAVPVLRVEAASGAAAGELLAIVFGYACHTTTLPPEYTAFHGDYAGEAEARLEERHPGAVALFISGCGGDVNPRPRGTLDLARQHGATLAGAVDRARATTRVEGRLRAAFDVVPVPFAPVPDRDEWTARLRDENPYVRRHAQLMLDTIAVEGSLPAAQHLAIQVWRLGAADPGGTGDTGDRAGDRDPDSAGNSPVDSPVDSSNARGFTLVAMGGEVVAGYAVRLKQDYPGERLWIAGYSDDLFGYLPSRRVLEEGGYEGGAAMIYFGKPGPFAPGVEETVHAAIGRLMSSSAAVPSSTASSSAASSSPLSSSAVP